MLSGLLYFKLFPMSKSNNKTHLKLATNKLQRPQQQQNKMGMFQSFKGYITNFSYGLEGIKLPFFSKTVSINMEIVPDLYVGGKRYNSVQQCMKAQRQLIWFTYKKNFKISLRYHSDIGWGCLIRVGQMAMAQALRRFLSQSIGNVSYSYIITPFLQSQTNAKYNITKFVTKAEFLYSKKPGQWFSITQVATILQELHQQHPLKCSQYLKVNVCIESINIKKLTEIIEGQTLNQAYGCLNYSRFGKREGKKSYIEVTKSLNSYPTQKKKHIMLILIVRLGQNQVPLRAYNSLLEFMKLPMFIGCLGGIPNKARFLTGVYKDEISYLDPHYVQDRVQRINLQNQLDKFSCKEYRVMSREQLDPNIGLCFYLKNKEEIHQLTKNIDLLNSCQKRPYIRYESTDYLSNQFEMFKQQKKEFPRKLAHEESFSDLNSCGSMQSSFVMD